MAPKKLDFTLPTRPAKKQTRLITMNLPEELVAQLDALAKKQKSSRTALVAHFCRSALEQLGR